MKKEEIKILAGKTAVVTGGASGIGAAFCKKFAAEGAAVACLDMDQVGVSRMEKELHDLGIDARGYCLDVTDEDACFSVLKKVIKDFGAIDILCNNAGITQRSAFRNTDISVYRRVMEVNFFGSLACTKAALESLIDRQGTIVVTSSIAGIGPLLGRTGYSASKHALHGLFESLRTEVSGLGVNILMLCPGFTRTNLQKRALDGDGTVTTHPQSKIGAEDTPEHVADRVLEAILQRKSMLVLTRNGKIGYLIRRLFPALYESIVTRKFSHELKNR